LSLEFKNELSVFGPQVRYFLKNIPTPTPPATKKTPIRNALPLILSTLARFNYFINFGAKLWCVNWFQTYSYIGYVLNSKRLKHSRVNHSTVNELLVLSLDKTRQYYHFEKIDTIRQQYLANKTRISITDKGAGSQFGTVKSKTIAQIARHSAIQQKYGELLSRLIINFKPLNIIELGTSLGISTLYLSLPNKATPVTTIEACSQCASIAKQTFNQQHCNNIQTNIATFDEALPSIIAKSNQIDVAFIDGNHRGDATFNYFQLLLQKSHSNTIFVFDDIHWTRDMFEAWQTICRHPQVSLTIDLFQFGVVFFHPQTEKQHLTIKY